MSARGNLFFYLKRNPGEPDNKLYVRRALKGAERLLVDPGKINDGVGRYSLGSWSISWDGKYVSYVVYAGGAEVGELRVVETANGADTGDRIDRVTYGAGEWLPGGRTFLYNRLQKLARGARETEKYQRSSIYLHALGTGPETDKPIFGFGLHPDIVLDQNSVPFPSTDPTWQHLIVNVKAGVSPNLEVYAAPLSALTPGAAPWRRVVSFEDEVTDWNLNGDDLYLKTYKGSPRYQILRTNLNRPARSKADIFFSGGSGAVIMGSRAQRDAMYVETLEGGLRQIWRVDYRTKKARPIKMPDGASGRMTATESGADGVYFRTLSYTKSTALFKYDPKADNSKDTGLVPPAGPDMSHIEFVRARARSHDGAAIPLVIIYRKGLKRDGSNPVLMDGYGAYGYVNTTPEFIPHALPWLERGGIYVMTGVRGGGEYGTQWHQAGKGKNKPNGWKDFIACAEYLINERYTSPEHLGIQGTSAGGVIAGNAMAERPELFGAAVINVGYVNPVRGETTASGLLNVPEFGSVKTE